MIRRVLLCSWLLLLCACASQSALPSYYTLHSQVQAAVAEPPLLPGGLGVGPIFLPESFRQREVAVLSEGQRIHFHPQHLWAGDPKLAISRVLSANLSAHLQLQDLWAHPWDARVRPRQQILVVIERLVGHLGGDVELVVQWRLSGDYGATEVATGREQFQVGTANRSYDAYVQAVNELLHQFSHRLAEQVLLHWNN